MADGSTVVRNVAAGKLPVTAEFVVTATTENQLMRMVEVLRTCPHPHNFVLAFDGLHLYCSDLARQCLIGASEEWAPDVDIRPKPSTEPMIRRAQAYQGLRLGGAGEQSLIEAADHLAIAVLSKGAQ